MPQTDGRRTAEFWFHEVCRQSSRAKNMKIGVPIGNEQISIFNVVRRWYCFKIQNRAMSCFLAVNKFTPTHALYGELAWVMPRYRRWLSFAQLWNGLFLMNDNRIVKKMLLWDRHVCCNSWSSEIFEIPSNKCSLEHCCFELSMLKLAYMGDCMHERTNNTYSI